MRAVYVKILRLVTGLTLAAGSFVPNSFADGDKAQLPSGIPEKAKALGQQKRTARPAHGGDASLLYRLSGQVSFHRKSELSFRVGGFIEELKVKEGDLVKKGDILATIDQSDLKLAASLANVSLQQAKVAYDSAKRQLEREKILQAKGASAEATYDQLSTAFEQAKIALSMARIEVDRAKKNVSYASLTAPYDGIVVEASRFLGEHVMVGRPVFVLQAVGNPELKLELPERLLSQVNVNDAIDVSIPAIGYSGKATIARKVPVISSQTRSFTVYAALPDDAEKIVPGLFAEVVINRREAH